MSDLGLHAFFDPATSTLTYVVWDSATHDALVIDPVMDYDPVTQMTSRRSLGELLAFIRGKELRVGWILETHAHADHLSSGRELRAALDGAQWGMGARMSEVFSTFKKLMAWPAALQLAGLGTDRFFADGEEFHAGSIRVRTISTPGHTPACVTFQIGDWLFTGDALFLPDSGTGRCDFPGGSAGTLWDSVWGKLYSLNGLELETFPGHDYQPGGRPLRYRALLSLQRDFNIHLRSDTSRAAYVAFREGRDKTLSAPRLLQAALDWNLGAHQIVPRP